jgi:hypothetical protein
VRAIDLIGGMWRLVLHKYYDALKFCIIVIDLILIKDREAWTVPLVGNGNTYSSFPAKSKPILN